mmetsp:Transcript_13652/g.38687  ORF Transcript_13652/g.38687 Transcript_13652/m.38687 type:complete len:135 (-) Transcript_13652:231-635(-)
MDSDGGSTSGRKSKKDGGPKVDPAVCDTQIKNLDRSVKRLHQQRFNVKKKMAEDEEELKWVLMEIKQFEEKKARILENKSEHEAQKTIIVRSTQEAKSKLQDDLVAQTKAMVDACKKAQRNLQKKEYVSKHAKR